MAKGGFCLRKWTSNKLEVLQGLEPDQIGTQSAIQFGKDETIKALGISWEPEVDIFRVETALRPSHGPITKRTILSGISQLFDPLGIVSPVVIRAKMLMQLLWLQPCGWDDAVSESIADKWNSYTKQLPKLSDFHVPRYALLPNATIQLHTFSDASEAAYGACTYARSVDSQGNVAVHLLASKSCIRKSARHSRSTFPLPIFGVTPPLRSNGFALLLTIGRRLWLTASPPSNQLPTVHTGTM